MKKHSSGKVHNINGEGKFYCLGTIASRQALAWKMIGE
jgi:hypothetical protein